MINFTALLSILGLSVVTVAALRRLHLPPILGYLFAGAIVGPYGFGLLESKEDIRFIAEFGVVFLLFTIGLELSLPKLISMRRSLLGLGGMQVVLCSIIAIVIAKMFGLDWGPAIIIAGAFALSSTAVASKQLVEQEELLQTHGKLSLSILLFQDLAAVPFLIIVPILAPSNTHDVDLASLLLQQLGIGLIVFTVLLAVGRWFLRPLFHHIAMARSSELFMLTALLVVLASAFVTEHYGLSAALGAFIAGVMLAETEYAHQIESDIQPFRDILLGLFFISVGLLINPMIITEAWPYLLAIVTGLILTKVVIIALLGRFSRYSMDDALRAGLILAQGGEFGLFLLARAKSSNIIDTPTSQLLITSIVLSMIIAPILIRNNKLITEKLLKPFGKFTNDLNDALPEEQSSLSNHVIICGYGRVGQTLARFLVPEGIQYVGIDLDPKRLKESIAAKEPVFFGNATNSQVLQSAGIENAKLLIIAFNNPGQALKIITGARRLNSDIKILVRTENDRDLEMLQIAGANEVIPDILESSLMLAKHMLILLGHPVGRAHQLIWEVKTNRYKMLQGFFAGEDIGHIEKTHKRKFRHAVELTDRAYAVAHTIEEISSNKIPIHVVGFARNGFRCDFPCPHTVLRPGDIIIVEGSQDELFKQEEALLQG